MIQICGASRLTFRPPVIHGLGEQTKLGSSFIVQSIVGGAIMPFFMGWLADKWGMRLGFLMPLLCFIYIAIYGLLWQKLEQLDRKVEPGMETGQAQT